MAQPQSIILYDSATSSKPRAVAPFVGPGRLVHKFNVHVGRKVANSCSKLAGLLGYDPSCISGRIEQFFGSSPEEIQSNLDLLYNDSINTTQLKKDCMKLLNYAWPQSSSETTQWAAFDFIIVLTTRYPGLRKLFCQHRNVPDPFDHVQISKKWLREGHMSGPEFDFYRDFASFCLHKSRVVMIVEGTRPSDLARIEWPNPPNISANVDGPPCLNYIPIEYLLLSCRHSDGTGFTFERLSAIRYLTTILQLPAFWVQYNNHFVEILSNICDTMYKLIEDTDSDDPSAERNNVWMRVALASIDDAIHALLVGIKRFMPRLQALTLLISKLCRLDVMARFPVSSPIASEIKSCLQSDAAGLVETEAFELVSFMTQIDDMGAEGSIDQYSDMQSESASVSSISTSDMDMMQTIHIDPLYDTGMELATHFLYPLKMYGFRQSKNRWKRTTMRAQGDDPPPSICVVTWNIDFATQWPEERVLAVLRHLEHDVLSWQDGDRSLPCCILLQEVHVLARDKIMEDDWVRRNFSVTDSHKWRHDKYGNLTLVEKSIKVVQAKQLNFGWTIMDRAAIVTDLKLWAPKRREPIVVRVVNTHLESLRAGDQLRPCQLQGCVQVLKDESVCGGIIAGDMSAITPGDDRLPQQNGLRDAWWRDDGSGNTWGYQCSEYPPNRPDKILFMPNCGIQVSEPELIGIGVECEIGGVFASDHFGLTSNLHVLL